MPFLLVPPPPYPPSYDDRKGRRKGGAVINGAFRTSEKPRKRRSATKTFVSLPSRPELSCARSVRDGDDACGGGGGDGVEDEDEG